MKIRALFAAITLVAMAGAARADEIDNRLENMGLEQLPSGFEAGEQLVGEVNNTPPTVSKVQMPEAPNADNCPEPMIRDKNGNCGFNTPPPALDSEVAGGGPLQDKQVSVGGKKEQKENKKGKGK